jgi:hypothetical protein
MNLPPEKLHELLTYCTEFAETMLKDSGEFYPFGAVLDSELELRAVGADVGEEHPASAELYQLLGNSFIQNAKDKEISASAIACNVNIPQEYEPPVNDGVRVHLECDGFSRYIYVPFSIETKGLIRKTKKITFFEPISVNIDAQIFEGLQNA